LQIKNSMGLVAAETLVFGDSTDDVLMSVRESVEAAENGDDSWAESLDEEFA
jgi:hypothetical protein